MKHHRKIIKIFALSTLLSYVQVLNLSGVIQEDQLQYLQFATEYAKYADDDNHGTSGKPFQNLMFLVRDWVRNIFLKSNKIADNKQYTAYN